MIYNDTQRVLFWIHIHPIFSQDVGLGIYFGGVPRVTPPLPGYGIDSLQDKDVTKVSPKRLFR